jgi:hypothetical protein
MDPEAPVQVPPVLRGFFFGDGFFVGAGVVAFAIFLNRSSKAASSSSQPSSRAFSMKRLLCEVFSRALAFVIVSHFAPYLIGIFLLEDIASQFACDAVFNKSLNYA